MSNATPNFGTAFAFTWNIEGGYVDDDGGPTFHGITLSSYQAWLGPHAVATIAVLQAITEAQGEAFYAANYWQASRCDDLPPGTALSIFDMAVNAGCNRSGILLQELLGFTGAQVDGWIGPKTLSALDTLNPVDMDGMVRSLSKTAVKALQGALHVAADGIVGPKTLAAVHELTSPDLVLCAALYDAGVAYYASLDNPTYEAGWQNRAAARLNAAIAGVA